MGILMGINRILIGFWIISNEYQWDRYRIHIDIF